MEEKEFQRVFDFIVSRCRNLMVSKNTEYGRGGNKFHNFVKAAEFAEGGCQIGALKGMMLKHTISIYDMIQDVIEEGNLNTPELWKEKVVDHINYLIILYAMVIEQSNLELKVLMDTNYGVYYQLSETEDASGKPSASTSLKES